MVYNFINTYSDDPEVRKGFKTLQGICSATYTCKEYGLVRPDVADNILVHVQKFIKDECFVDVDTSSKDEMLLQRGIEIIQYIVSYIHFAKMYGSIRPDVADLILKNVRRSKSLCVRE